MTKVTENGIADIAEEVNIIANVVTIGIDTIEYSALSIKIYDSFIEEKKIIAMLNKMILMEIIKKQLVKMH